MKKLFLVVFNAGLLIYVVSQCISLRQYSAMRAWMTNLRADEIVVGVEWPFSDNQDGMDEGLLLAQEELNAKGVAGKRIRLIMRDDHLDREDSRKIAIEFAHMPNMSAAIGFYDDSFAVRSSAVFEESHLLHIVAGANNTYMTTHGFRYLIRSVLANDRIGLKLALMGVGRGYRNFAIVAEDGPFGEDLAYQTGTGLDVMDAHVVYHATYVRGSADFRTMVDEIKESGADAILFLGLERESARFIKTAHTMGLKMPIVGSFSDTPVMHSIAGNALEGVMFYEIYDVNSPTPENRAFVAKYRRRFGYDPDAYGAQGYDALRILAKAVETTGSTDSLDLAYGIRDMGRWEGANGSYKFNASGELDDKDIYLKIYRGGKAVVLTSSRSVDPGAPPVTQQKPATD
jgi:branched-chain amino acid transport system substrate-binding protein